LNEAKISTNFFYYFGEAPSCGEVFLDDDGVNVAVVADKGVKGPPPLILGKLFMAVVIIDDEFNNACDGLLAVEDLEDILSSSTKVCALVNIDGDAAFDAIVVTIVLLLYEFPSTL
jgi:hypothetical protein